jgi:isopentenyl-diphosphate delta-isomerase type 1
MILLEIVAPCGYKKRTHFTGKYVMTATEYVVLVDENDNELGRAEKLEAHVNNLLHRAFSVFIFKAPAFNEILLQQRALSKYHSPGLWTNTCCSHPRAGENIIAAGKRRLREELDIKCDLVKIGRFYYQTDFTNGLHEHEVDHVLIGQIPADLKFTPNPQEVHTTRWITLKDLHAELKANPEHFTPWLSLALDVVQRTPSPAAPSPARCAGDLSRKRER